MLERIRAWAPPLILCMLCGMALSALPHLIQWTRTGSPAWIADYDEKAVYLPVAAHSLASHPLRVSDPASTGTGESIYPWVQIAPGILGAKALGLSPWLIGMLLRIWSGAFLGGAFFLLARNWLRSAWASAGAAIFLMGDIGTVTTHILVKPIMVGARILFGKGEAHFAGLPELHSTWRLITPGLSLSYLIFFLVAVSRSRETGKKAWIAAAAVAFGSLFYVYFYWWTAAGLALLLLFAIDAPARKRYFAIGLAGVAIGTPKLLSGLLLEDPVAKEALHRADFFLPISRFSEWLAPKGAILAMLLTTLLVWRREFRSLLPAWALALSGLLLLNHQIFTGLQTQNYHYGFVYGPTLSAILAVAIALKLRSSGWLAKPAARVALIALLSVHFSLAIWLRHQEATRTRESGAVLSSFEDYRAQRLGPDLKPTKPLERHAVAAGDQSFVDSAMVGENLRPLSGYLTMISMSVSTEEYFRRTALSALVEGLDRDEYEKRQRQLVTRSIWGKGARDPEIRQAELAAILAAYDEVAADPARFLDHYEVRYAARAGSGAEARVPLESLGLWTLIEDGPQWKLWERKPG